MSKHKHGGGGGRGPARSTATPAVQPIPMPMATQPTNLLDQIKQAAAATSQTAPVPQQPQQTWPAPQQAAQSLWSMPMSAGSPSGIQTANAPSGVQVSATPSGQPAGAAPSGTRAGAAASPAEMVQLISGILNAVKGTGAGPMPPAGNDGSPNPSANFAGLQGINRNAPIGNAAADWLPGFKP